MSARSVKKCIVRLSPEARDRLEAMIGKGKHPATQILKADLPEAGEGWSDSRIVEVLDTSLSTVERTLQRRVEGGVDRRPDPQTLRQIELVPESWTGG